MAKYVDADKLRLEIKNMGLFETAKFIKTFPSEDVSPVIHAHWKEYVDYSGAVYPECARCGLVWWLDEGTAEDNEMYYCPKCGAKMDGEAEADEL